MTSRIRQLMQLYMEHRASDAERNELLELLQAAENEEEIKKGIRQALEEQDTTVPDMNEEVSAAVLEAIFLVDPGKVEDADRNESPSKKAIPLFRWLSYAAAMLLAIATGIFFFIRARSTPAALPTPQQGVAKNIAPGGQKAILTLANGSTINLDDAHKGDIARDGSAAIAKTGNSIVYHVLPGSPATVAYNTITTPRGGQYHLDLSDGSKVWLNASSSLHFPTTFTGKERTVALTGEAYFEIAKNSTMPFTVTVNGLQVKVLGTSFNINAYMDEPAMRTTLIDGAVSVVTSQQELTLKPGQQASATDAGMLKLDADLEEVMAWKNGIFNFKDLDIATIMRQISRWYDVEIVYEGKKPEGHFSGMISRNIPAQSVLKILEAEGIHFTIASNRIVIGSK